MTWSSELGARMTFAPARQIFESWWHLVPDERGIYCVLLDQGKEYNDRVQKWKFPLLRCTLVTWCWPTLAARLG